MTTATAPLRSGPGRTGTPPAEILPLMGDNPRVRYRQAHGELPAWIHVATQRHRPGRPDGHRPPKHVRPRHRKPRRSNAWLLAGYTCATAAGALMSQALSALVAP